MAECGHSAEDVDVRRNLGWGVGEPTPDQDQRRRPHQAGIGLQENVNALEAHHVADEQDEPVSGQRLQAGIFRAKRLDIVGHEVGDDLIGSAASGEPGMARHRVAHRDHATGFGEACSIEMHCVCFFIDGTPWR